MTADFRPGQRVRHTELDLIVTIVDPGLTQATVRRSDDGREISTPAHLLEPATSLFPIPPVLLAELADWLNDKHEEGESEGTLLESISYKLRTLAGEDVVEVDLLPVEPTRPTLQRAIEDAEHRAGGGCDECPPEVDPYARIAALEAELAQARDEERTKIVRDVMMEAERVRADARAAGRTGNYSGIVAAVIDKVADRINDQSL